MLPRSALENLESDTTEGLTKVGVPTPVLHGDDDQIVPIESARLESVELLANRTLEVCPGAPHGLTGPPELELDGDPMGFIAS